MKLFLVLIFAFTAIGLGQVPADEPDFPILTKERITDHQVKLLCRRDKHDLARRIWKCAEEVPFEIKNIYTTCSDDSVLTELTIRQSIEKICGYEKPAEEMNKILACTSDLVRNNEEMRKKVIKNYAAVSEVIWCLERVTGFPLAAEYSSEE